MMPPAARKADQVTGTDTHIILVPSPSGAVPTPMPLPFSGSITGDTSNDVFVNGFEAAMTGSEVRNLVPHVPTGGPFQRPPSNKGSVQQGSSSVFVNGRAAARQGDQVATCNDPTDAPTSTISAGSPDVSIG